MSMPKPLARVRDLVLAMMPALRVALSHEEETLAPHLRGNTPLYESLVALVNARLNGRALQPPPSEPIDCRASMERDYELRWLLSRLDFIYHSPVHTPAADETGEPPA